MPGKSFYFLGGLTEATETITIFAVMCIWPEHFAVLAYGFAGLCAITTGMRVWLGVSAVGAPYTPQDKADVAQLVYQHIRQQSLRQSL